MCLCCKGGAGIARISIEELYRSEGGGAKYGDGRLMGAVIQEINIDISGASDLVDEYLSEQPDEECDLDKDEDSKSDEIDWIFSHYPT